MNEKPNTVERTTRRVIEGKLLEALGEGNTVAVLLKQEDLRLLIRSLDLLARTLCKQSEAGKATEFCASLKQLEAEACHVRSFSGVPQTLRSYVERRCH